MKILFFYFNLQQRYFTIGLGLASLSGYLTKKGFTTELIYFKNDSDIEYALNKIAEFKPQVIGYYSTSVDIESVKQVSLKIRNKYPSIFQILGGVHATLIPDTIYDIKTLDAVCVGFGEVSLHKLMSQLEYNRLKYKIPGMWFRPDLSDPDNILKNDPAIYIYDSEVYLNYDYGIFIKELSRFPEFNKKAYSLEVIFSRICPFNCSFCSNSRLRNNIKCNSFLPSPEDSINFLKRTLNNINANIITIHDDILTLNKKWFRTFIELYKDTINIPFICNLRAGLFNEENVILLKKANVLKVWIGIESGNEYIRKVIMKKDVTNGQLREAFRILHKHNIKICAHNIIGVPKETPNKFLDTIKLNAELKPDTSNLSIFYPYPGTELAEYCSKKGYLNKKRSKISERKETILSLPEFPEDEISFYYRNFMNFIKYLIKQKKNRFLYWIPLRIWTARLILKYMYALSSSKKELKLEIAINKFMHYSKIIICGNGSHTRRLLSTFSEIREKVIAISTLDKEKNDYDSIPVISEDSINDYEYDAILVSSRTYEKDIYTRLLKKGISKRKIHLIYN